MCANVPPTATMYLKCQNYIPYQRRVTAGETLWVYTPFGSPRVKMKWLKEPMKLLFSGKYGKNNKAYELRKL